MPYTDEIYGIPMGSYSYKMVLVGFYILLCVYIQKVLQYYNKTISDGLICMTIGIIIVLLCYYTPQTILRFHHVNPRFHLCLLEPIFIVIATINMEIHLFLKCLPLALLFGTVGMVIFTLFFGYTMQILMHLEFNWIYILCYGCCMSGCDVSPIMNKVLRVAETLNLPLAVLTTEMMINITHSILLIKIMMGVAEGIVHQWYHFVGLYLRNIGGGIILGLISGNFAGMIMGRFINNLGSMLIFLICIVYMSYYLSEHVLYMSGTLATFVVSLFISREKSRLSIHAERRLKIYLESVYFVISAYTTLELLGCVIVDSIQIFELKHLFSFFASYFVLVLAKLLSFLVLLPFVWKRRSFTASLFVIMFFTRRGMIQLLFILILYYNRSTHEIMHHTTCQLIFVIYFQLLIYNIGLKKLIHTFGLATTTFTKRANLANCVRLITEVRRSFLTIMKMDKCMGDANWDAIEKTTVIEELMKDFNEDEEEKGVHVRSGVAACNECQDLRHESYIRFESIEEVNDIRIRILQTQKISFIRQKERGQMFKNSLKFLLFAIDSALESPDLRINVNELLHLLQKRNAFDYVKDFIITLTENKMVLMKPRSRWRRFVFILVMNSVYDVCMYIVILTSLAIFYINFLLFDGHNMIYCIGIPQVIFFLDIVLRIIAYWQIEFIVGIKNYLSDPWNIFDVIMFMINALEITLVIVIENLQLSLTLLGVVFLLNVLRIRNLRILKLIHVTVEARGFFLAVCNHYISRRLLLGFGVAQSLLISYNEALHILPALVENRKLRFELEEEIVSEKAKVLTELSKIQLYMSNVAITAKTRRVLTSSLNTMSEAMETLKLFGFADDSEYNGLKEQLEQLNKPMLKISIQKTNTYEQLFFNQPFFERNRETEFLFKKATLMKFNTWDEIVTAGSPVPGIYVIVDGIAVMNYHIDGEILGRMITYGALPIKEYIAERDFQKTHAQQLIPGNCVGIISVLTKRASDCNVRALVPCKAYFIPSKYITDFITSSEDQVNGLHSRLWKFATVNLALSIIWNLTTYQSLLVHEVYYYMEKSFVPNLTDYEQVFLCDSIEDTVLIEGRVMDVYTRNTYIAPCYLPRSVRKINFTRKRFLQIEPQLFIIPFKSEYKTTIFEMMESVRIETQESKGSSDTVVEHEGNLHSEGLKKSI